jgi:hypothetical protein
MHATGLFDTIGQDKVFATEELAIAAIYEQLARVARMILYDQNSALRVCVSFSYTVASD